MCSHELYVSLFCLKATPYERGRGVGSLKPEHAGFQGVFKSWGGFEWPTVPATCPTPTPQLSRIHFRCIFAAQCPFMTPWYRTLAQRRSIRLFRRASCKGSVRSSKIECLCSGALARWQARAQARKGALQRQHSRMASPVMVSGGPRQVSAM